MRRSVLFSILVCLCFLVAGCENKKFPADYEVGVLYSTEYKNTTKLLLLNQNLESIYETNAPYGYLGHCGFMNAITQDGVVYECPQGKATEKELGLIIGVDMSTGKVVEYDFGRVNITDFACEEDFLYATSNLNNENFVDRYDRTTGKKDTVKTSFYVSDIVVNNGELYGFGLDEANPDKICFYHFDFNNQRADLCLELSGIVEELVPFLVSYQDRIYWAEGEQLFCFHTDDRTLDTIELPYKHGFNLLLKENTLWIGCTNIFAEDTSHILVYDLEKEDFLRDYQFTYSIHQMEVTADALYVGNLEFLEKYVFLENGDISFEKQFIYNMKNDYYLGGFFVNESRVSGSGELEDLGIDGMESMTDMELNKELIRRADEMEVVPDKTE